MTIEPVFFLLKDGRQAIIRSPREEDIADMQRFLRTSTGETEYLIRTPGECDRFTHAHEKATFEHMNAAPNAAMLLCLVDSKIAGSSQISWIDYVKVMHRASVSIGILQTYWSQGIGTKLFEVMIGMARATPHITQLELDFVQGNTRARALYEKLGFRLVGVKPNAIRQPDGTLLDEYSMILPITR